MKTARGFRYAMEALRRRREWELEAARLEAAQERRLAREACSRLEALEVRFAAARTEAARRGVEAFSAHTHRVAAGYFAALGAAIASARQALARHEKAADEAAARAKEAHAALLAVERHREEAHAEFVRDAERRDLASADEMWTQMPGGGRA